MMQAAALDHSFSAMTAKVPLPMTAPENPAVRTGLSGLSPAAMAVHLLRTHPASARCFAQAMYEGSAWANDEWGDYWADVMNLV